MTREIQPTFNKAPRYYADLNPAFGAWQEQRYCVFERLTRRPVARAACRQYQFRSAAERAAARLNALDAKCNGEG